jgi:hypothetical protein
MVRLCSCGFATDDDDWLAGHLTDHPGHREMDSYWTPDMNCSNDDERQRRPVRDLGSRPSAAEVP